MCFGHYHLDASQQFCRLLVLFFLIKYLRFQHLIHFAVISFTRLLWFQVDVACGFGCNLFIVFDRTWDLFTMNLPIYFLHSLMSEKENFSSLLFERHGCLFTESAQQNTFCQVKCLFLSNRKRSGINQWKLLCHRSEQEIKSVQLQDKTVLNVCKNFWCVKQRKWYVNHLMFVTKTLIFRFFNNQIIL